MFDIINLLVTLTVFTLPVYFAHLGLPLSIQISPAFLFVVPVVITLYKRRLETKRIESQKIIDRALKEMEELGMVDGHNRPAPTARRSGQTSRKGVNKYD